MLKNVKVAFPSEKMKLSSHDRDYGNTFEEYPEHLLKLSYLELERKNLEIKQACDCPSGRLTACENGKDIEPKFEKSIGVIEDPESGVSGPLWIRGGIPVESASGEQYEVRNRVTLCRCGKSKNKPFCNGSHMTSGFKD